MIEDMVTTLTMVRELQHEGFTLEQATQIALLDTMRDISSELFAINNRLCSVTGGLENGSIYIKGEVTTYEGY